MITGNLSGQNWMSLAAVRAAGVFRVKTAQILLLYFSLPEELLAKWFLLGLGLICAHTYMMAIASVSDMQHA